MDVRIIEAGDKDVKQVFSHVQTREITSSALNIGGRPYYKDATTYVIRVTEERKKKKRS